MDPNLHHHLHPRGASGTILPRLAPALYLDHIFKPREPAGVPGLPGARLVSNVLSRSTEGPSLTLLWLRMGVRPGVACGL